jgi:molybdopterin-synthase adenylyltransferase
VNFALLSRAVAYAIWEHGGASGTLHLRFDSVEGLIVVDGYQRGNVTKQVWEPWLDAHYSSAISVSPVSGTWHRADPELHDLGRWTSHRGVIVPLDDFRSRVKGFYQPHRTMGTFVITIANINGEPDFVAWQLVADGAAFFPLALVDPDLDLLVPLGDAWPLAVLADKLVTVIGVGSIGSSACEGLVSYGLRRLALVDPDRLLQHNLARHRANTRDLGRYKVNAVSLMLRERDPAVEVDALPLDVADDADVMRPLLKRSACVLVCSDGVESRRVANHLACHAMVPAVFACVLEDGALGEVIRVRPRLTACLYCSREQLTEEGVIDPEPLLDRGYGTGYRHLPMTAVGGDLDLIGKFAARTVASTLLEAQGFLHERLPGDHAVFGLRPSLDREPQAPFDVERTLELRWHVLRPPSPGCPSCGSAV